jgi:hypothetical protein
VASDFPWMLRRIAALLEGVGISGTFDLFEPSLPARAGAPPDLRDPLFRADLLECRWREQHH